MIVAFYPDVLNENPYLRLLQTMLARRDVQFIKVNEVFRNKRTFKCVSAVHFNWYEIISERKRFPAMMEFIKKCAVLLGLRMMGKRIVWTMHNKQGHEQNFTKYSKMITWLFVWLSETVIIHSKLSEQLLENQYGKKIAKKARYVPHPHYIEVYGGGVSTSCPSEATPLRLLFLGAVRPYKNIELLLDVVEQFEKDVFFTIAGKPLNTEYQKLITERCAPFKNIHLKLEYIEDREIPGLIGSHDLLILPYDVTSSLNSGSVILAASYGRSVICPAIGTVLDFENKAMLFTYTYLTPADHFQQLTRVVSKAIELKRRQPDVFIQWGKCLFDEVRQSNNERLITTRLYDVYSGVGR